jgi:hypothetical protein
LPKGPAAPKVKAYWIVVLLKTLQNRAGRAGRADRHAEMQSVQAEPAKRPLSVTAVVMGKVRTVH